MAGPPSPLLRHCQQNAYWYDRFASSSLADAISLKFNDVRTTSLDLYNTSKNWIVCNEVLDGSVLSGLNTKETVRQIASYPGFKPGSHLVVFVIIIGNFKHVQANTERNLSPFLQLICAL